MLEQRFGFTVVCFDCSGFPVKRSYLRTSNYTDLSNGRTMSPSEFLSESCSYHINGTNGASSSPYVKELRVLEACDDEYGGVVVNAKKLPPKLNAFASALRSSVSHWRTTVNITMIPDAAKVLE